MVPHQRLLSHTKLYGTIITLTCKYIYICVCVCVCVCALFIVFDVIVISKGTSHLTFCQYCHRLLLGKRCTTLPSRWTECTTAVG